MVEALRALPSPPPLVLASTNKVYGHLESAVELGREPLRYSPRDPTHRGFGESLTLDFYSPYGCSKGAADQYVLDYARVFGLPAAVLTPVRCCWGLSIERSAWSSNWPVVLVTRKEPS